MSENIKVLKFSGAKNDFELLDLLRFRYQMYANDISSLNGILIGYALANEKYKDEMRDFGSYLSDLESYNSSAISWSKFISRKAELPDYEVPIFYEYLDGYRKIHHEVLGEVSLSWEQRDYDFRRSMKNVNVDYPKLPLKAPSRLVVVRIPNVRTHAFFYDQAGKKYYEMCFNGMDHVKKWAKECFNIDPPQW